MSAPAAPADQPRPVGLAIGLICIVTAIGLGLLSYMLFAYHTVINRLYHRRLVPKGQRHAVDPKQEPITYGFGYNKPHHVTEGALNQAARGPSLEAAAPTATLRKSSTLEFPGLPTVVPVDER